MRLSANFDSSEFRGWATSTEGQRKNLAWVVANILQPIRDEWGPLRITAWVADSPSRLGAHPTGGAVDFVPMAAGIPMVHTWAARELRGRYGEIIDERNHIHVTRFNIGGRGEVLVEPREGVYVALDPTVGFPDGQGTSARPITIPGVTASVDRYEGQPSRLYIGGAVALLLFLALTKS